MSIEDSDLDYCVCDLFCLFFLIAVCLLCCDSFFLFFHNALCLRTVIVYPSWLSCGLYLHWCSEVKENMLILLRQCRYIVFSDVYKPSQGAKKVSFTAYRLGKLWLAFTSPKFISTSPKNFLISWGLMAQFFCSLNSSKNFTCPADKLRTEFTSPIAKSTSPGLSDTTFFKTRIRSDLS